MFEKLDHINLTVKNLSESLEWYGKVFGLEKVEVGNAMGTSYAIIARNDFALCLYEERERKSAEEMGNSEYHQIYHFGIRIKDLESWRALLKAHKLKLYYGGEVHYSKSISWYIHDPSGHEIEVSYTEKGLWG